MTFGCAPMQNPLIGPVSPLRMWFWLLQSLAAACIVGYWIQVFGHFERWQMQVNYIGVYATVLFVISNIVFFRSRMLGIIGSVICWILVAIMSATL